jgi:hypothetical protein
VVVWANAGPATSVRPAAMATAETSFRMQVLLLVDRDLWPPLATAGAGPPPWFRYKNLGTIQADLHLDKFDSVNPSV